MKLVDTSPAVFITGAAGGIGAATTRALAAKGYRVFAGYHRSAAAVPSDPNVTPVQVDVTDPASVANAAKLVADAVADRGLRAVVNNAGLIVQGPLELLPPESFRRQFDVNTLGPAFVVQAFLPLLRAGNGRVINVSAPTARMPIPFMSPIGASKAALASWSTALRGELAAWRLPVVLIDPGATKTEIFADAARRAAEDLARASAAQLALYRGQLDALAAAGAKFRLGEVDVVVAAIVKAVTAKRPKRYYAAGRDARVFGALSHLPAGLRQRLVMRMMGLTNAAPVG